MERRYVFDKVFPMDSTQEKVFEQSSKPLLDGVLGGYNATIFAYGVSALRDISNHADQFEGNRLRENPYH